MYGWDELQIFIPVFKSVFGAVIWFRRCYNPLLFIKWDYMFLCYTEDSIQIYDILIKSEGSLNIVKYPI